VSNYGEPWKATMQRDNGRDLGVIINDRDGNRIGWVDFACKATNQGDEPPYERSMALAQYLCWCVNSRKDSN
jgi:hypothetical protein